MLLKALYDLAYEKRLFEKVHLQDRQIHLLIPINFDGELTGDGVVPLASKDTKGKDVLGKLLTMPRFPGENNGGKAYFLAESCLAVLGIDKESGEGIPFPEEKKQNPAKSFLHFWKRIQDGYKHTSLPALAALMRFRERYLYVEDGRCRHRLPFIEIRKTKAGKIEVGALTMQGNWERLAKLTLTFQIGGNLVFDHDPNNPLNVYWRDSFGKEAFSEDDEQVQSPASGQKGLCLVTEKTDAPIARSHKPKILGIPGLTSGGYLVSFAKECPSFSSYGFQMGENATVSEEAAASYALALQSLLDDENCHFRVGPSLVCFWAKKHQDESAFFARMLTKPDPKTLAEFLKSPWGGLERRLAERDPFYSVTLSGNAGRVVVRHWIQTTVDQARNNLRNWFSDLEIVQANSLNGKQEGNLPPLALFRLACATVRESKDLQGHVLTHLYGAAIEGIGPPIVLLEPILQEFESALVGNTGNRPRYPFNPSRFALLRLILNRNRKAGDPMMEPQVFETHDAAYNCGRLLAVLADAQAKAHEYGLEGPGVAERYFGSACVSPSSVFPLLLRLNRHHLDKIKKSEKIPHHAAFVEDEIQNIMARFKPNIAGEPPDFPRHLDLRSQARFALGFYQQKAAADSARKPKKQAPETPE